MKKLMIAAAIVCAAVASQASTALWNVYNTPNSYIDSPEAGLVSSMVYVYQLGAISQDDVLEQFRKDGTFLTGYVASGNATDGAFSINFDTEESGASANFFIAATDGANILLMDEIEGMVNTKVPTEVKFDPGWLADEDIIASTVTFSDRVTGEGYGDGWYAADVPEPTSGLLLLLGVAGLALKRKRA